MKSKILNSKNEDSRFPGLYVIKDQYVNAGTVVLMEASNEGMVVHSPFDGFHKIGKYMDFWDMSNFEPFDGEISLSSES